MVDPRTDHNTEYNCSPLAREKQLFLILVFCSNVNDQFLTLIENSEIHNTKTEGIVFTHIAPNMLICILILNSHRFKLKF